MHAVAARVAQELAAQGAAAVALVGSHARGTATANSDVDLAVVGEGPHYRLEARDGVLVSIGCAPEAEQRRRLSDPAWLVTHVPGWRTAVPLHDPEDVAASLVSEAKAWTWEPVAAACDAFAAEAVTGLAEEAQKLAGALRRGDAPLAAVQRSLLALGLARPVALRRRILCPSENELWATLAVEFSALWSQAFDDSAAAFELYRLAVDEVRTAMDERQREVADLACSS